MAEDLKTSALDELFNRQNDPLLLIENDRFIDANQAALDLIGVSSLKVFKTLHPAMISPEFQPDGQSSKNKADKIFAALKESGYEQFIWQHITLHQEPFNVQVTLRSKQDNGRYFIDVHWHLLDEK